jgi:hypothetical protein
MMGMENLWNTKGSSATLPQVYWDLPWVGDAVQLQSPNEIYHAHC